MRVSWQFAVGFFAFEWDGGAVAEISDQLLGREDGADFDFPVLFGELEALAGLEVHRFTNFFRDYDLVFG